MQLTFSLILLHWKVSSLYKACFFKCTTRVQYNTILCPVIRLDEHTTFEMGDIIQTQRSVTHYNWCTRRCWAQFPLNSKLLHRLWTTHYFKVKFLNPVNLYELLWKAVCSVSNRRWHHLASGRVDILFHSSEKGGGGRKKRGMTKQDKITQRSSALCAVSPSTIEQGEEQGAKGREMSTWGDTEILSDQRLAIIVAFVQ